MVVIPFYFQVILTGTEEAERPKQDYIVVIPFYFQVILTYQSYKKIFAGDITGRNPFLFSGHSYKPYVRNIPTIGTVVIPFYFQVILTRDNHPALEKFFQSRNPFLFSGHSYSNRR